jgi:hypothetical protein
MCHAKRSTNLGIRDATIGGSSRHACVHSKAEAKDLHEDAMMEHENAVPQLSSKPCS